MNLTDILTLYDYNNWANAELLSASQQVNPEQFLAPVAHSFGSLRGTLVHILDAECAWRMLCGHGTLEYFGALDEAAFPTLEGLEQRWAEEERALRNYLATLTDDDLRGYLRYTTAEGDRRQRPLWHCLWHVVNHGTHHRSDAAAILREYGVATEGLDFTRFLNETRG